MTILVRLLHYPVEALGPGKRVGLWLQGCSIHCKGCIAPENQPFDPDFEISVELLLERISELLRLKVIEGSRPGLTISGGEPFDQPKALYALLKSINSLGIDDILVYSGYSREMIIKQYPEFLPCITALVDGPFILGQSTESAWKGSDNQTLTVFQDKYFELYRDWSSLPKGHIQLVRDDDAVYLIGIPRQEDVPKLKAKIKERLEDNY